ncbi:putative surface protein with fasciclin (FAS1) repeats [Lewinella aquimaris]|uniref:Putative surface protein with fasciclin (FAS1) repeats n=1 Tax=Neolewinella aquimaris TaxID=1835722 RepID=A0A840DZF8_9BACT|nr:fasciclin domain-containing protein [Neolewinella aquimaris]MBB4078381.1 putative surface protein with fasciclin (FAS1) repeats [Neolewinella aquimaris]
MKSLSFFLLLLASIFTFSSGLHAQEDMPETDEMTTEETAPMTSDHTIGEAVAQHAETTTLATALESAGLTDALDADGSFILLAPTDEAFAALPDGVLDALLLPENGEALVTLLQHHLIDSSDSASNELLSSVLNGDEVTIGENLSASNGQVYLIDQVLIPEGFDLEALQGKR